MKSKSFFRRFDQVGFEKAINYSSSSCVRLNDRIEAMDTTEFSQKNKTGKAMQT